MAIARGQTLGFLLVTARYNGNRLTSQQRDVEVPAWITSSSEQETRETAW